MLSQSAQWLQDRLAAAFSDFLLSFTPFLQHQSQFYWPFLVSTIVVAAVYWGARGGAAGGRGPWAEFRHRYFGRDLWWHPSARADYRYYFANAVIYPVLVGPALWSGAAIAGGLDSVLKPLVGTSHGLGASGWPMRITFTIAFFIAYDFGRFVAHSALHDVPFLWEFHKPHHSAEVLTPVTAFRAHPVDLGVMAWGSAISTGICTALFHWLGGPAITFYQFLGMHAVLWGFNLLGNLKHWQVWISYGPVLDYWLISPAHHQLHHSAEPRHFGLNRGFEIALWDRLYGTLALPRRGETFRMGLGDGSDGDWHRVWKLYLWPIWFAALRLVGRGGSAEGAPARPT
jgi:sterol desaturase/sphingolipid hydroxylase (fatty acid hydroxylase superfamily)